MRDGAWQFVGAVVGILALVVAILQFTGDDARTKEDAPQPATGISGSIEGDCNALGTGNAVDC